MHEEVIEQFDCGSRIIKQESGPGKYMRRFELCETHEAEVAADRLHLVRTGVLRPGTFRNLLFFNSPTGPDLCYGQSEIDWENEEGHAYVRCYCPSCGAEDFDSPLAVPHKKPQG